MQATTEIATKAPAKSKTLPVIAKTKEANKAKANKTVQSIANSDAPKEGEIVNRYNYAKITDASTRTKIRDIAKSLRALVRQERDSHFNIGLKLNEAKDEKAFGDFENWAAVEFPTIEKRTSKNYMAMAREFKDTYALVSYLPDGILYTLAQGKLLGPVRAKVIERAEANAPLSKSDVQSLITQANKAAAKGLPAPKDEAASLDNIADDVKDRAKEIEGAIEAAREAVAILTSRLDGDFDRFVRCFAKAGEAFAAALSEAVKVEVAKEAA